MKREKTNQEEWFNTLSHGLTAFAAILGFALLIVLGSINRQEWSLFSGIIYGFSLMFLYTASTVYHGIHHKGAKEVLRIIDHSSIYILIAGTYTPVLLLVLGNPLGWTLFGIQWGLAFTGIILKIFFTGKFEFISVGMYLVMGWMALVKIQYLYNTLPHAGFWLLFSGGLAYTFGVIFYVFDKKIPLGHFIWHLFVIGGSLLHFLLVTLYII